MKLLLPQNRWFGDEPVEIDVPDSWDTHVAEMDGDKEPVLTLEQIKGKIDSPYGSDPLFKMAKGKKSACIVFDDMSRGTPCKEAAHIIVEELLSAGIPKDKIVFICGVGMHGALERDDFVKKLGEDIVAEYAVFNHNPYENLVEVGTTSRGFKVMINAEYMRYELRIGIGGLVPHPTAGFGGGSKIILPGVTGLDTVCENHKSVFSYVFLNKGAPFSNCIGDLRNKDLREDVEETAMLAGLDFKVDILMNTKCEIIDVYAGHPIIEYYEGVKRGFDVYNMDHFDKVDVCIVNANAKSNESGMAFNVAADCINDGGDIVMVNFCPTGPVNHYLVCMWGLKTGGRLAGGSRHDQPLPSNVGKFIIFSPYKSYNQSISFASHDRVVWASTWEEVMANLSHRGPGTKAAVIREGLMSMFSDDFKKDYTPVNLGLKKQELIVGEL